MWHNQTSASDAQSYVVQWSSIPLSGCFLNLGSSMIFGWGWGGRWRVQGPLLAILDWPGIPCSTAKTVLGFEIELLFIQGICPDSQVFPNPTFPWAWLVFVLFVLGSPQWHWGLLEPYQVVLSGDAVRDRTQEALHARTKLQTVGLAPDANFDASKADNV